MLQKAIEQCIMRPQPISDAEVSGVRALVRIHKDILREGIAR